MSMDSYGRRPVPGSRAEPLPGAQRLRNAPPNRPVDVLVVLRRAVEAPGTGADPQDLALVETFARDYGLAISGVDLAARSVGLAGTVAQMNDAFGVDLGEYRRETLTYRGRQGMIYVPSPLVNQVRAVLGLDDRPQAQAHFMVAQPQPPAGPVAREFTVRADGTGYTPREVAQRYGFPTEVTGSGQTVAIIELGGGYLMSDLDTYFTAQGLRTPVVTAVSVDGGRNTPGGAADGEVMLDIEVVGSVAQDAQLAVYFAPNTSRGFYDAIAAAIHDTARRPSVISISWGQAESGWTPQSMGAYDALFADAVAAGITVYAAAGDDGAADQSGEPGFHVDFPASSPNVVGCGGTSLTADAETVWNQLSSGNGATGGGVSQQFGLPGYQRDAGVPANPAGQPGRGVPDVAGNADPLTGYRIRVDGEDLVIGGTSAVAPLWAGLTALVNSAGGAPVGGPHARLYAAPGSFGDIVSGNNGGYDAGPGWDACTGLGVPDGAATVRVLRP